LTSNIKGDYAANAGDSKQSAGDGFGGNQVWPTAATIPYTQIDSQNGWTPTTCKVTTVFGNTSTPTWCQTGVIHYHSEIKLSQITDGASNTYLVGEKSLQPSQYEDLEVDPTGAGTPTGYYGDNQGAYTGFEWDNERVAWNPEVSPTDTSTWQPRQDTPEVDGPNVYAFGSAHAGAMNMAMCDGSVQAISYDIDPTTHRYLAIRNDGQVTVLTP
jgi:prepilin-type processing-associated H-X9-DG protein